MQEFVHNPSSISNSPQTPAPSARGRGSSTISSRFDILYKWTPQLQASIEKQTNSSTYRGKHKPKRGGPGTQTQRGAQGGRGGRGGRGNRGGRGGRGGRGRGNGTLAA